MAKINTLNYQPLSVWDGDDDLFIVQQADATKVATPNQIKSFVLGTVDEVPTQDSNNLVKSGGIFSAMAVPKYNSSTETEYFEGGAAFEGNIDSTPTAGSNNAVASGGTKTYVDNAVSQLNDEIAKQAVTVTKTSAVTSNSGIIAYICNNFCFVTIDANILSGAVDGTVLATGFTKPIYFVAIGRTTKAFDIEINSSGELIIKGTPTTGWVQGSISYMI